MTEEATDVDAEAGATVDELTVEELMTFAVEKVEDEANDFEAEIPNHAGALIASRATDLLETLTNIQMAESMEDEDEEATLKEEDAVDAIEEDAVDILLALGALQYERGLDITTAVEERMQFIEDYQQFQEAMQEAESQEEAMEVMDEHMTDEIAEEMGVPAGGVGGIEPGDTVDRDGYDHDEKDKGIV